MLYQDIKQSCETCSKLALKLKAFNLPQNMAFLSSNIDLFLFPTDQFVDITYLVNCIVRCTVRLTFVLKECSTTKPSSLISHMVNLPHG